MTTFITNVTNGPLWVPASIKAPPTEADALQELGVGRGGAKQGLLEPGEKLKCKDEAAAQAFARQAGDERVKLSAS